MLLFATNAVATPGTAIVSSWRTNTTHFHPRFSVSSAVEGLGFPAFLPKEVENIKDPSARKLASRIQRLQVTLWKTYIRKPVILVGPSLGAAIAIDFAVQYPEAVEKLVLIDASVYVEGTGSMATLPKAVAYAGVSLLKSVMLRLFVNVLAFEKLPLSTSIDWMNIGRLHCMYDWWADATVNFMSSGGYDVACLIPKINQKTLIIWGEDDKIISSKLGVRLHCELPNAIIRQIPNCGHIPHVEKPDSVARLIKEFVQDQEDCSRKEAQLVSSLQ
ncbi:unnamed protein product [Linum tenue]|uniref:AB hydrolase-1 domain-containing protein n=1 Tax=Linum tenue TaxID=586396 RepID=A0AAV0NWC6_9ROSI|nr:unnamed protein product [Linum tenue]